MPESSELEVLGATKEFAAAGGPLAVLRGVDLRLHRGDALAITGPSGAGKSTLLYLLGALETPTAGTYRLLDESPWTLNADQLAQFRNRRVGFVFQDHHLLPQCTVLENVLIPTLAAQGTTPELEQRAHQLLERVGLTQRLLHRPAELSGGERQRVAVCRALIQQPVLLLADEPTGSLDGETAQTVGQLLLDLNREQQTILICVTHSLALASKFPLRRELREGLLSELAPR